MTFDYHKAMAEGHSYNHYVADLLRSFGVPNVDVPEFSIATTHDKIADKTKNEKDIVVDQLVLEVKSRAISFEGADDFPHALVLVDTVYGFDQKIIKPFAYIYLSQVSKGIFAIPVQTRQYWTIATIYDQARQIEVECYFVSKRHCRPFIELVDILLERAHERAGEMQ